MDIAILGVGIAILGVDVPLFGVDIAFPGVDIAILGVDIAVVRVDITILGVDISILDVDIAILMRQEEGGGLHGEAGRGALPISYVIRLEAGWGAHEFGDNRGNKGREAPCYKPILGVRLGRGLGCRGIIWRNVRSHWVVALLCLATISRQRSGPDGGPSR